MRQEDLLKILGDRPWCDCHHKSTMRECLFSSPRHAHDPVLTALGDAIRRNRRARASPRRISHVGAVDRSYMSSIRRGVQNPASSPSFALRARWTRRSPVRWQRRVEAVPRLRRVGGNERWRG